MEILTTSLGKHSCIFADWIGRDVKTMIQRILLQMFIHSLQVKSQRKSQSFSICRECMKIMRSEIQFLNTSVHLNIY